MTPSPSGRPSWAVRPHAGVNANATSEVGERYHARLIGGKSVWWTWTAPAWGQVTIDTIGSTFDTLLGVSGSSLPALVSVACNNDLAPGITASSVTSRRRRRKGLSHRRGWPRRHHRQHQAEPEAVRAAGGAAGHVRHANLERPREPDWTASTTATAYDLYRGTSNNSALAARIATD